MAFSSLSPSYITSPSLSPQLSMLMDDSQSSTSPPPSSSSSPNTPKPRPRQTQKAIAALENELDFLRDECATINVVLTSLRDAYVSGSPNSQEDAANKEVLTAYDDLTSRVIQLERKVKILEHELKSTQGEWQGLFCQ